MVNNLFNHFFANNERWFRSINHKDIGVLYLNYSFICIEAIVVFVLFTVYMIINFNVANKSFIYFTNDRFNPNSPRGTFDGNEAYGGLKVLGISTVISLGII